jgi:hypothetical protein
VSAALPLWYRGEIVASTLVDEDLYDELSEWRWYTYLVGDEWGYAVRSTGDPPSLHRYVTGCRYGDGLVVHHVNEDRFDNRRANLQVFPSRHQAAMAPHPRGSASRIAKCRAWAERFARERALAA